MVRRSASGTAPARKAGHRPASRTVAGGQGLTSAEDNTPRYRQGERLEQLFEERCDALGDAALAVDGPAARLRYAELEARANRVARYLLHEQGVRPGDRVGLLFDDTADAYAGMLAALKAHAVYVPLDPAFPEDRISYIAADAAVRLILSHSRLAGSRRAGAPAGGGGSAGRPRVVFLDEAEEAIAGQSSERLGAPEVGSADGDLCYLIYTSGTTGRPKGVAVGHPSICNFVRVAAEMYGFTAGDRVYQGMTMAFDFAIEEIWVPWLAGATLVPKPPGGSLLGRELGDFLREQHVTALCCVPTLLATLDDDLPELTLLLVSGESCPQELVARWHRPARRFLNVYGPTEATVSATWTVLEPGRPVTIGVPLPTYSVVILDPDAGRALPRGETGEIGIAGVGLADGYLNRPERTASAFVRDFAGLPDNPPGKIYRTGDLGRVDSSGEIEHCGRIDTQVKIRGYRVELAEVESVLAQAGGVAQAVAGTHQPAPGVVELVGYYRPGQGPGTVDERLLHDHLRGRLPGYMVPAFLEELAEIPTTASGKVDRKRLPPPSGRRRGAAPGGYAEPAPGTESVLAGHLAAVLQLERVSADADFFDELGASSLLMARFTAALPAGARTSMRDVYQHRTLRRLAAAIDAGGGPTPFLEGPDLGPAAGTPRYVLCGTLQLIAAAGLVAVSALLLTMGAAWLDASDGTGDLILRALAFGAAIQGGLAVLPVAAKWIVIGRWKPRRITIWSMTYLRFWMVKTLLVASPLARLSIGTSLYGLYLRALGARVGRGAVIFSKHPPVCTDLLTVGDGAVVRKDCYLNGYRARSGVIEIAPVTLGAGAFVGERTVLDIATALEDGAQLGHTSSLQAGQTVPAGECWHGSPARPAGEDCNYRTAGTAACGPVRRGCYAGMRLLSAFLIAGPLETAAGVLMLSRPGVLARLPEQDAPIAAAAGGAGLIVAGLLVVGLLPRLLARALQPGKVYPLYGRHYTVQRLISRLSNIRPFNALFGDSVAIVHYLRLVGYRLGEVEQTGSNFGTALQHEIPALSAVGRGTMVSDGLSMINADFSSSSFRVRPAVIGARNFLGNYVSYPAGGRTGDDCLIATKAMVPLTGPVRERVGLLGSPSFEIPRSVERDRRFDCLSAEPARRRRIAAKTRHNLVTMALHVGVRYVLITGLIAVALLPLRDRGWQGWAGTAAATVADLVLTVVVFVLAERAVLGFRPLRPRFCSIYQPEFWAHERYWKVPSVLFMRIFDGTPAKPVVWRLLGVRAGRRVFDDGCRIVERSLCSIGDHATLNMASVLHSHSLEEATFKSGHISIGPGCTVGTGALVHYDVAMEQGSVLEADSFLMKGSRLAAGSRWLGNPATETRPRDPDDDPGR